MSMSRHLATLLFGFALLFPVAASAVTEGDFQVKDTQSLINLCTAPPNDPLYGEAINFCHGYLVGAVHYDWTTSAPLFCPPDPAPSRNDAIERFITWAKARPQYMKEVPVETEFRFLTETWPCK
jgi:Rap1a immunity proteins